AIRSDRNEPLPVIAEFDVSHSTGSVGLENTRHGICRRVPNAERLIRRSANNPVAVEAKFGMPDALSLRMTPKNEKWSDIVWIRDVPDPNRSVCRRGRYSLAIWAEDGAINAPSLFRKPSSARACTRVVDGNQSVE